MASSRSEEPPLKSWKEIAAVLGRDVKTARRWEARGLPVHRVPGSGGRSTVHAYASELTDWLMGARADGGPAPPEVPAASQGQSLLNANSLNPGGWALFGWTAAACVISSAVLAFLAALTWGHSHPASAPKAVRLDPPLADLYAAALHDWDTRSPDSLRRALGEFQDLSQRQPTFAPAYVGIADTYNLLREYGGTPPEVAYARAQAAAQHAIALDERLAGAHRALAFAELNGFWNVAAAKHEYQRALVLEPDNALTHQWYATSLLALGDFRAAADEIGRAQRLDPYSRSILADSALIKFYNGDAQSAVDILDRLQRSDPDFLSSYNYLSQIRLAQGDAAGYVAALKELSVRSNDSAGLETADAGEQAARSGPAAQFAAMLKVRLAQLSSGRGSSLTVAQLNAVLGHGSEAAAHLRVALSNKEPDAIGAVWRVEFRRFRAEPAFRALLAHNPAPSGGVRAL